MRSQGAYAVLFCFVTGFHRRRGTGLWHLWQDEVVPEKLRTLDHGRPWSDDQFASTRLSSNRDMSR